MFLLANFEATLDFSRTKCTILAHNNITKSYYVLVDSLQLKSTVTLKWARNTLIQGNIYFAVDGTWFDIQIP